MADLNYYWRLFATGFSFFVFGLGGLVIAVLLLPLVWILKREPADRHRLGKKGVQLSFRFFLELMRVLGVMEYRIQGFDQLVGRSGMLIIANHPTLIDVIFLVGFIDNADCVVKQALKKNPATFGPITAAGYLVNAGGEEWVQKCVQSLEAGKNLIIFPEGTRTVPGEDLHMQRGAANIALRAGRNLTPILIQCTPSTLTKSEKWYQIPPRKFVMTLRVLQDVNIHDVMLESTHNGIASRKLTRYLVDLFTMEIHKNERYGH